MAILECAIAKVPIISTDVGIASQILHESSIYEIETFETAKKYSCKILYPEDVVVGKSMSGKGEIKSLNNVKNDDYILDIGPKTTNKIKDIIEKSKTIL